MFCFIQPGDWQLVLIICAANFAKWCMTGVKTAGDCPQLGQGEEKTKSAPPSVFIDLGNILDPLPPRVAISTVYEAKNRDDWIFLLGPLVKQYS